MTPEQKPDPCKHCGSAIIWQRTKSFPPTRHRFECTVCSIRTDYYFDAAEALLAWNRRPPSPLDEALRRVEAELPARADDDSDLRYVALILRELGAKP